MDTPKARQPVAGDPLRGVRRLAVATSVSTLALIVMGGMVRATDSGLACPDWPACYGKWIPPADVNMWFEHSHRLWAGVVMLLTLWLAVWTTARHRERRWVWRLSLAAAVLVLAQAGLGAAVVLALLAPGLVMSHLAMSLLVIGSTILVAVLSRPSLASARTGTRGPLATPAVATAALVFGQAVLGGLGTGYGIAYVFNAFPIWSSTDPWTASARQFLHGGHRAGGYLVAVAVLLLIRATRGQDCRGPGWVGKLPRIAAVLVLVQIGFGIGNVLTHADALFASFHLATAGLLWAVTWTFAVFQVVTPRTSEAGEKFPSPATFGRTDPERAAVDHPEPARTRP